MGKVPNHKAKKGHNKKGTLPSKQAARNRFLNRHIDQVRVLPARAGATDTARSGGCADTVRVWRRCGKTCARPPRNHAASARMRRCHGRQSRSSMRTSPAWASSIVSSLQAPQHHATARVRPAWKKPRDESARLLLCCKRVTHVLPCSRSILNPKPAGVETGKWFVDAKALAAHKKGRFYKMRVKELKGAAPHSQRDAEMAVGLGVDNGPRLRPKPEAMETV